MAVKKKEVGVPFVFTKRVTLNSKKILIEAAGRFLSLHLQKRRVRGSGRFRRGHYRVTSRVRASSFIDSLSAVDKREHKEISVTIACLSLSTLISHSRPSRQERRRDVLYLITIDLFAVKFQYHAMWGEQELREIRKNPLDQVTGSPVCFLPCIDMLMMMSIN